MTNIKLHGILAKEFCESTKLELAKASDVVRGIDANRPNFQNRISQLAAQGMHYTIIVDGIKITDPKALTVMNKPKQIDLVPVVCGSGPTAASIGYTVLAAFGATGGATSAGALVGGYAVAAYAIGFVALTAVSVGLQLLLAPDPDGPEPISATTRALDESFTFSNKVNLANQGSPVPVGYGRLKVGSQVIQFCVKSFPQSQNSLDAMLSNPFELADGSNELSKPQTTSSRDL